MLKIGVFTVIVGFLIQHLLIDGMLQGPFAEGFVSLCQEYFQIDYYEAVNIYQKICRNFKELYLVVGFLILLFSMFYVAMSRFSSYFNEVRVGMDKLVQESDEPIHLSPELDFMEVKMNKVNAVLKKRANDAKEAEQRKDSLVVYLAHDIKTPLTSVIGYMNLMLEMPEMSIEQKSKYLEITLTKAYRLEQLINELFDITRFNMQSVVLEKEKLHLSYMLMQMAEEFYPVLEEKKKTAEVDAPQDTVIFGDPNKLARVFNNILKNAIAYSFENTVIRIRVEEQKDMVVITFTNHGEEIPDVQLKKIFEQFYRLDSSRTSDTGGAGLGLAIAREIVLAHGGRIFAGSNAKDTVFTVELPFE